MTQAISRSTSDIDLDVQLTSMAPVETVSTAPTAIRGSGMEQIVANTLLLYPEEPSEIVVRLENLSDYPLSVSLEVDGDYPPGICLCCLESLKELAPWQKEELSLPFKVRGDVFEHQYALSHQRPQLQLDYQIHICVYQDNSRLVSYKVFTLYVRPRTTYLNFLPTLFREIDFIRRFLSIFEQAFDPYVQTLDTLWAYLDPLTAPESLLSFLAHWVAWPLEPNFHLERQRQLIRNALELYRWHGTRYGLRFYLHLYTALPFDNEHISIEEIFGGGFTFGNCHIGEDSMLGGGRPYHFVVRLRREHSNQQIDELLVRTVIEREKPPFCTYDLDMDR